MRRERNPLKRNSGALAGGGETRNGRMRDRVNRGSTRREKYTSVANESRDDWFAYSRYVQTVCFHLLSRSRVPLFPLSSPRAFISLRAVQFIPHSRTVRAPMATTFNKYRINAFTARRTDVPGPIQTSRRRRVKFTERVLGFYRVVQLFSKERANDSTCVLRFWSSARLRHAILRAR